MKVPVRVEWKKEDEALPTPRAEQPLKEAGVVQAPALDEEIASDLEVWRDRALRLQAEMENFRKRQRRLTEERVAEDRERLLRSFLHVADDLQRALQADQADSESLRQGVRLTRQGMLRILEQEGAEPVAAQGRPFDSTWHEAVGTAPGGRGVQPGTVVEVVQEGYRLGDRLLRPARVIVAA
jgi:molecular chaperone GrpE